MQYSSIPTCYFPTTALFLDDSRDFLLNFVLQLDEGVAYRIFDAPYSALNYIHKKNGELDLLSHLRLGEFTQSNHAPVTNDAASLDLAAIHTEVYNPHRFAEISVVVVDYAMPGMDGLEFCRRIENPNVKKILLTGQADEKLAIAAFNEGLIHRYIKKSDPNAADLITKSIYELQFQYFQGMSDAILRMLAMTAPTCLQDKKFARFFHELRANYGVVEYYLIDQSGGFLLLDEDANVSFLLVKAEEELAAGYQVALDSGASKDVLAQLASGEKIPMPVKGSLTGVQGRDWDALLITATEVVGDKSYYYAYSNDHVLLDLRQQKILSYHRYLEELDAEELLVG